MDDELIAWVNAGADSKLTAEDAAARRRNDFSRRFFQALYPDDDLGPTQERHDVEVARRVQEVHYELNALGEEAYSDVWSMLSARDRRAIKTYVGMVV